MIKVAVSGADTPQGGELTRILVNHPEVDIISLCVPGKESIPVSSLHHGLIGECALRTTQSFAPEAPDVLFVCGDSTGAAELYSLKLSRPELKIIILDKIRNLDEKSAGFVFGLPEINRKLLVRGATAAFIPSPPASLVLTPLFPLAANMLLNNSLKITVKAPRDIIDCTRKRSLAEIEETLADVQKSFTAIPEVVFTESAHERLMEADIEMECKVDLPHLLGLYEMYDDHNFSFPVTSEISPLETAGTDKCVFSIRKENDTRLRIHAVADPRMRGGAGEAVHVMNLLCGLHEKTGLALKASAFSTL